MIHQVDRNGLQSIRDLEGPADGPLRRTIHPGQMAVGDFLLKNLWKRIFMGESLPAILCQRVQVLSEICLQDYKIVLGD